MQHLSVFTLWTILFLLMSPSSCAERIHKARVIEIKEALADIKEKRGDESAIFEIIQSENDPKTITVKTNSLNVVESVEELLIMTPAWRENIVIDYSPAAAD